MMNVRELRFQRANSCRVLQCGSDNISDLAGNAKSEYTKVASLPQLSNTCRILATAFSRLSILVAKEIRM